VAVSAFASNVLRMQSVIKAGAKAGRHVALVGHSMLGRSGAGTKARPRPPVV